MQILAAPFISAVTAGDYNSISTVTVGVGGQATIEFSSIPATYKHLQIRGLVKGATGVQLQVRLNSDTTANYSSHNLAGDGASAQTTGSANVTFFRQFPYSGMPTASNTFGVLVMDILDYADTNKRKTVRTLYGQDSNGSGEVGLASGSWFSTSAVSTVTFLLPSGSFPQYSTLALYGING
jgi:hypothetical protein